MKPTNCEKVSYSSYFYLKDVILDFSLPVTSYNIPNCHIEQLDLGNIDKAV